MQVDRRRHGLEESSITAQTCSCIMLASLTLPFVSIRTIAERVSRTTHRLLPQTDSGSCAGGGQVVAGNPLVVLDSLRIDGPSGCGENSL